MDAHLTISRRPHFPLAVNLAAAVYLTGITALYLGGGLLLWRRIEGTQLVPLQVSTLLVTSVCLGFATLVLLQAGHVWQSRSPRSTRLFTTGLAIVPVILSAGSLCLPGTTAWGLAVLWAPLVLLIAGQTLLVSLRNGDSKNFADDDRDSLSSNPSSKRTFRVDPAHSSAVAAPHFPPEDVSQQLTRSCTEDGRDLCHGWIRASFDQGQRQQIVHLAFCPPFQSCPELSTSLVDGQMVEVKHAQLMPYGARVELKRDRSMKESSVALLRFSAVEVQAAS